MTFENMFKFSQVKEKFIEKLKYVNQENYDIPVRETAVTKKAQNIEKIKVFPIRLE